MPTRTAAELTADINKFYENVSFVDRIVNDAPGSDTTPGGTGVKNLQKILAELEGMGASLYDTTTIGLANTVDGDLFMVKGSGDVFALLYKNVTGSAVSQSLSLPSTDAVNAKVDRVASGVPATRGIVPVIAGQDETLIAWYDQKEARLRFAGDGISEFNGMQGGWSMPLKSANGAVAGGMHTDGNFYTPVTKAPMARVGTVTDAESATSEQVILTDALAERPLSIFRTTPTGVELVAPGLVRASMAGGGFKYAEFTGVGDEVQDSYVRAIVMMGQSLSVGGCNSGAEAILTSAPSAAIKMWAQGIRPFDPAASTSLVTGDLTTLVDAKEAYYSANFGETGLLSLAWALNGPAGRSGGSTYHIVTTGKGNTAYSGLKKGSVPYTNAITSLTALKTWCDANGKTLILEAVIWDGGENNSRLASPVGDTSADSKITYDAHLAELLVDFTSDTSALGVTGTDTCPWLVMQRGIFNSGELSGPSQSFANAAEDVDSRFICVGPQYMFDFQDLFHPASDTHRSRSGYYAAKIREKTLHGQNTVKHLKIESVEVTGLRVTLTLDAPVGPIHIGTDIVSDPGNFGLSCIDSVNSAIEIAAGSIEVLPPNQITFELESLYTGSLRVRAAWDGGTNTAQGRDAGPRTCIFDSALNACPATGQVLPNFLIHQEVSE